MCDNSIELQLIMFRSEVAAAHQLLLCSGAELTVNYTRCLMVTRPPIGPDTSSHDAHLAPDWSRGMTGLGVGDS